MQVTVSPATSADDLKAFIRYPLELYRGDPCFVSHLLHERSKFFSPSNPLFKYTDVTYYLARERSGQVVGRITAHVNKRHNQLTGENTGFFGFFECIQDPEVAGALVSAAEIRLQQMGMTTIRGPFNFSTNEECGFLTHGFDRPPVFMMPYNPAYYLDMMDALGYRPVKTLLAYEYTYPGQIPEHLVKFSERLQKRTGVVVRPMRRKNFEAEVGAAFDIYNMAWEKNWGFIPVTEDEFRYVAADFKAIIDPALALIAEKDGRPVAFSLALPDYNVLFKKMNGRLFPFGFLYFIFGRRLIRHIRVLLLGVLKEYRRSGVDILLYYHTFKNGLAKGYRSSEMSWILEDNTLMRRALERMGASVGKRYRIYEKSL